MIKNGTMASLLMFTWFCLGGPSTVAAADRPILQEGDRWEFKASTRESISNTTDRLNGLYEVVFRGGQIEVFEVTGTEKIPIGGNAADELKRMILPDEREYLKFPLAVGNKWTGTHTQGSGRWRSIRSMNYAVTSEAGGRYKIEGSGGAGSSHPVSQTRVFIYSPSEKAIVKFFYDSAVGQQGGKIDIELVKLTAGGK